MSDTKVKYDKHSIMSKSYADIYCSYYEYSYEYKRITWYLISAGNLLILSVHIFLKGMLEHRVIDQEYCLISHYGNHQLQRICAMYVFDTCREYAG